MTRLFLLLSFFIMIVPLFPPTAASDEEFLIVTTDLMDEITDWSHQIAGYESINYPPSRYPEIYTINSRLLLNASDYAVQFGSVEVSGRLNGVKKAAISVAECARETADKYRLWLDSSKVIGIETKLNRDVSSNYQMYSMSFRNMINAMERLNDEVYRVSSGES